MFYRPYLPQPCQVTLSHTTPHSTPVTPQPTLPYHTADPITPQHPAPASLNDNAHLLPWPCYTTATQRGRECDAGPVSQRSREDCFRVHIVISATPKLQRNGYGTAHRVSRGSTQAPNTFARVVHVRDVTDPVSNTVPGSAKVSTCTHSKRGHPAQARSSRIPARPSRP